MPSPQCELKRHLPKSSPCSDSKTTLSSWIYWSTFADIARFCSTSKNADDIVITLAIRTPLVKAKKGGFKDTSLEYMVYALLKEVKERSGLDPALVEDFCLGNVRFPPAALSRQPSPAEPIRPRHLT